MQELTYIDNPVEPKKPSRIIKWIFAAFALLMVVYVGYSTINNLDNETATDVNPVDEELDDEPAKLIATKDLVENPDQFMGSKVILYANITEWYSPRVISINAVGLENNQLLIVTQDPKIAFESPEVFGNVPWQIQGTVERFSPTLVIDAHSLDIDPELVADFESQPYILATSVDLFED